MDNLETSVEKFKALMSQQLERVNQIKRDSEWVDLSEKESIVIGVCWGDGIGESISNQAQRVMEYVLGDAIQQRKIEIRIIDGLTIENRVQHNKAIPDDVLAELRACDVILKGPTTTPQQGDPWPNIESANVAMRKELDLFACVRPVSVPEKNISWCFFRENTEGAYALGSQGFNVSDDLSVDFKIISEPGAERIIRMAFEYARKNNKTRVTVVTKSNVIKTTDGRFSDVAKRVAKEYEQFGISCDEWYIDIMTAKLIDEARASEFQVMVLPNLYGDILTDEAGQIQGGVGTAGSANIGKRYAMFEAIHGSAPRMVKEGRAQYADPCSMIKAASMLLQHIGYVEDAQKIQMALDITTQYEKKYKITGRDNGASGEDFTNYVLDWVQSANLVSEWERYTKNYVV
ncbi:MAG: isocitrate dehydrogenase [Actinobacteria bacterium]|nr:isocitrate dehydrogenase [Actinomycetota bacterium]|tara:strand:+ start:18163 stop:19371 length:1209 start_codon:yes stop_codon:yes gene_type:complete